MNIILYVEDNASYREDFTALLQDRQYVVITSFEGQTIDTVEKAKKFLVAVNKPNAHTFGLVMPNLIVLDNELGINPEGGNVLTKFIRQKLNLTLPVIILTNYDEQSYQDNAYTYDVTNFFTKTNFKAALKRIEHLLKPPPELIVTLPSGQRIIINTSANQVMLESDNAVQILELNTRLYKVLHLLFEGAQPIPTESLALKLSLISPDAKGCVTNHRIENMISELRKIFREAGVRDKVILNSPNEGYYLYR
jgi:DNA-binding response OmpR family regulator